MANRARALLASTFHISPPGGEKKNPIIVNTEQKTAIMTVKRRCPWRRERSTTAIYGTLSATPKGMSRSTPRMAKASKAHTMTVRILLLTRFYRNVRLNLSGFCFCKPFAKCSVLSCLDGRKVDDDDEHSRHLHVKLLTLDRRFENAGRPQTEKVLHRHQQPG